ncbi:MAG: hypothetical protein JWM11_7471, partial [Planctomycetaceae bacterium]|nr:hypothetical protein [Planctomycetaceae bacterium]
MDGIAPVSKLRFGTPQQIKIALASGIGIAVLVLLVIGIRAILFSGSGSTPNDARQADGQENPDASQEPVGVSGDLHEPRHPVTCRIYTPEPGFVAFIDDQPVRDAEGQLSLTPCEVQIERGQHVVRVEKKGWNDTARVVEINKDMELEQLPVDEPFNYHATTFKAPYLD